MALSPEERQILDYGKANGKTATEVKAAISQYRAKTGISTPSTVGASSTPAQQPQSTFDKITGAAQKVAGFIGLGKAQDTFGRALARSDVGAAITGTNADMNRQYIPAPTYKEIAGAGLQTGAAVAGTALTGGSSLLGQVAAGAGLGYLYDIGSDLSEDASLSETLTPGLGTAVGVAAPVALKGVGMGLQKGTKAVSDVASKASGFVSDAAPGVTQIGKDLLERVPRAGSRVADAVSDASAKAAQLKSATPATQSAIKSGLDEQLITGISQADDATRQAFRKMVDVAETPSVGLRPKVRPESVAGDVASQQYDILEKQRKLVGGEIGKLSDELSGKTKIDVLPLQRNVRDVLRQNGILPDNSGTLKFVTKRLTPQQQSVVQRLYELSTTDETLTPRQIHEFDQLFSKLQREARFKDQVDDIYLNVGTEKGNTEVNIFKVFRDIYSQQLDQLSPRIRDLNREYRLVKNLQDDLDASIFKGGNFETTKNLDGAEFAQTNLRRLFSDAQSAAAYRNIYDQLDTVSRSLGYKGARADELALFAEKLRKVYPDTVPETSFRGGISGAIETVMEIGKPNTKDQQVALKALLDEISTPSANPKLDGFNAGTPSSQGGYIGNSPQRTAKGNQGVSSSPSVPKLTAEMKSNIVEILDDYTLKGGKNLELQQDAARIAEDLGIPMPSRYGDLIKKLGEILDVAEKPRKVL